MLIAIRDALQENQLQIPFEGEQALALGGDFAVDGKATVKGVCVYAGEGSFIVEGTMRFSYEATCARCTKVFPVEITTVFREPFSKVADEDAYVFTGDRLDISDMLRDAALLALPMRSLCREDCKGLCPNCGADLNDGDCGCETHTDSPFAVLKMLEITEEV